MASTRVAIAVLGLVLVLSASTVCAEPSWNGSTGLINTPSAQTLPAGSADVHYHTVNSPVEVQTLGGNVGLGDGFEAGIVRFDPDVGASQTLFHVKYSLSIGEEIEAAGAGTGVIGYGVTPEERPTTIGVGVFDLTDEMARSFYIVATKTFDIAPPTMRAEPTMIVTGHAGFANARGNMGLDGLFAAAELSLGTRFPGSFVVEYDSDDVNVGVRYRAGRGLGIDVGLLDGDLGVGVTFRTGLR